MLSISITAPERLAAKHNLARFLSLAQIARRLNLDDETVRLAVRQGRLIPDAIGGSAILVREERVPELRELFRRVA